MLQSCTEKYTDNSDEKMFRFIFFCDCCGAPFEAPPIPFTEGRLAGTPTDTEIELWMLRWQKEHAQAFARANEEAAVHFFGCPGCGKYICPTCVISTRLPTGQILDRCPDCAMRSIRYRPFQMVGPQKEAKDKEDVHGTWRKITAPFNKTFQE